VMSGEWQPEGQNTKRPKYVHIRASLTAATRNQL
jgi:hypothetical protein